MSAYPLTDARRIVLPHEGPGGKRRVALGATVHIEGLEIRVYSVHAETRMKLAHKADQLKAVVNDLGHYRKDMPAIVLGDFNTWEPAAIDQTFELFTKEKFRTPFSDESTFFRSVLLIPIELKLDWIWLRNLEAVGHGIDREVKVSDHWPLWMVIRRLRTSA